MIGFDATLFEKATAKRLGALFSRICATMFEQRHSSPATLDLTPPGGATAGHPEEPWAWPGPWASPGRDVCLSEDEAAPGWSGYARRAAEPGRASSASPRRTFLRGKAKRCWSSGHPSRLAPLMRYGPPAPAHLRRQPPALRPCAAQMAPWCPRGLLLLELPAGGSAFALADFDTCRELRADARFLTCAVDPWPAPRPPGNSSTSARGFRSIRRAGAQRIPLPSPTARMCGMTPCLTSNPRGPMVAGLRRKLRRLSLAPAPKPGEDRLTAWIAPGARSNPPQAGSRTSTPTSPPTGRTTGSPLGRAAHAAGGVDRQPWSTCPSWRPSRWPTWKAVPRRAPDPRGPAPGGAPAAPERIHTAG
jgi:hypothetical protein